MLHQLEFVVSFTVYLPARQTGLDKHAVGWTMAALTWVSVQSDWVELASMYFNKAEKNKKTSFAGLNCLEERSSLLAWGIGLLCGYSSKKANECGEMCYPSTSKWEAHHYYFYTCFCLPGTTLPFKQHCSLLLISNMVPLLSMSDSIECQDQRGPWSPSEN